MATAVIAALGILTAAVGSFVGPSFYQRLVTFGAFRSLENIHGSDLKIIPGTVACEDLHRDPVSGQLFTACQARQSPLCPSMNPLSDTGPG